MKKINILSKNIYNRIAAGEVIERPYSAVKELIENSLDANATEIEIYIEKGGKQLIRVEDNGSGIDKEDLPFAFMPHATSKISCVEDLDNICTLGFRGEALASMSVIAKVDIVSVTEGNCAYKITCEEGNPGEVVPAALEKGTVICVRDLFYNTPVRAKFLKNEKKEESDITNFVMRYILGNPSVSFKYFIDGKLALQSFGGGLDEAIAQTYGAKVLPQCFKINAEKDGITISGFIGNQNYFKPNKTYQSIFLNGRYIINNTIATAISTAYASYTMKRQFPFYVLHITVPSEIVDVNVHPNKADVRFVDNRFVFGVVYSVVSSVLDGTAKAVDFIIEDKIIPEIRSVKDAEKEKNETARKKENKYDEDILNLIEKYKPETVVSMSTENAIENKVQKGAKQDYFDVTRDLPLSEFMPKETANTLYVTNDEQYPDLKNYAAYEIESKYFAKKKQEQQRINYAACKYRGSLFDTYLVYEMGDKVYFIDQHAAHERLLYDNLRKKLSERKIIKQAMLFPYIFETNPEETRFLESKISVLRSMGFGIAPFGVGSFRVDEVPVDLQEINIKEFFDDILANVGGLKDIKLDDILKDKIATTACKHAVKGGMVLTDGEIDALFKMLGGDMGLKCPHGRPICAVLSKKDIEKFFKRIV